MRMTSFIWFGSGVAMGAMKGELLRLGGKENSPSTIWHACGGRVSAAHRDKGDYVIDGEGRSPWKSNKMVHGGGIPGRVAGRREE